MALADKKDYYYYVKVQFIRYGNVVFVHLRRKYLKNLKKKLLF